MPTLHWLLGRVQALGLLLLGATIHAAAFHCERWHDWSDVAAAIFISYLALAAGAVLFGAYQAMKRDVDHAAGIDDREA